MVEVTVNSCAMFIIRFHYGPDSSFQPTTYLKETLIKSHVFWYTMCNLFLKLHSAFQDIDETLAERLWGLTEMFPESVRNATYSVSSGAVGGAKGNLTHSNSVFGFHTFQGLFVAWKLSDLVDYSPCLQDYIAFLVQPFG